jgi:hypothetical protein
MEAAILMPRPGFIRLLVETLVTRLSNIQREEVELWLSRSPAEAG